MSSAGSITLVDLGLRYWAQGLREAARSAFEQALGGDHAADAALHLAELELAAGDGRSARDYAKQVVKAARSPRARLLLGRAQLLAGELDGARFSFTAVLDQPKAEPVIKARAMLGRARVAVAEEDGSGAAANCMAALDELARSVGAADAQPGAGLADIALTEDILVHAVAWDRSDDAGQRIDALRAKKKGPGEVWNALWLTARQAHGDDSVSDAEIESAFAAAMECYPGARPIRLRRAERLLRRRFRDPRARSQALQDLQSLAEESEPEADDAERARLHFLLAAAYGDDPERQADAENEYRRGLSLRPGHASASNQLVRLLLARGDYKSAVAEIARALRIDAGHALAWRSAARILELDPSGETARLILDAARPGAGAAAAEVVGHLSAASAEVAREEVLGGMHARGHRMKNLLSIVGSRARSARKQAGEGEVANRLRDLEAALTSLYEEWASYLRSMHTTPVIESVALAATVRHVVEQARATSGEIEVSLSMSGVIPDLRGDRVLLSEALTNIVLNAVQACGVEGMVAVTVNANTNTRSPTVEIVVSDTGAGIPRADIARVFAPGYTTKDAGSGIGLAIAERVVSAHHGRILVESEVGQGTVMRIVLPCDLMSFAT